MIMKWGLKWVQALLPHSNILLVSSLLYFFATKLIPWIRGDATTCWHGGLVYWGLLILLYLLSVASYVRMNGNWSRAVIRSLFTPVLSIALNPLPLACTRLYGGKAEKNSSFFLTGQAMLTAFVGIFVIDLLAISIPTLRKVKHEDSNIMAWMNKIKALIPHSTIILVCCLIYFFISKVTPLARGRWVKVERDVYLKFDLDATPLQIKTDSRLGSGERVDVQLYDENNSFSGGFTWTFLDTRMGYSIDYCHSYNLPNSSNVPGDANKVWTIERTTEGLKKSCNGILIENIVFSDDTCGVQSGWRKYWNKNTTAIYFPAKDNASDYWRPGNATSCSSNGAVYWGLLILLYMLSAACNAKIHGSWILPAIGSLFTPVLNIALNPLPLACERENAKEDMDNNFFVAGQAMITGVAVLVFGLETIRILIAGRVECHYAEFQNTGSVGESMNAELQINCEGVA